MESRHKETHPGITVVQDNQNIQTSRELVFTFICCFMATLSFNLLCWGKVEKL